ISCKPKFLLPVRVLSKLFRRLMLEKLVAAHKTGQLQFFGAHAHLADAKAFAAFLAPLRGKRWFVYTKRPFAGPKAVLAYLSRSPAGGPIPICGRIGLDGGGAPSKVKAYGNRGPARSTRMPLGAGDSTRRFLTPVLPKGSPRIRHYGLFASSNRAETIEHLR